MATTPISDAIAAYGKALKSAGFPADGAGSEGGNSFADALRSAGDGMMATGRAEETQVMAATSGRADITNVVSAVSAAEVTLQTVTAVRDRVVAAYQEILRMPI